MKFNHLMHCAYIWSLVHTQVASYSEYSLLHHSSFSKNMGIKDFGGLTGYPLVLVHYIGIGEL